MKNKKGFTLIELLAVIIVLAIIVLIATPIVMNTIKSAKKGAVERSSEGYIRAVEITVMNQRLSKNIVEDGEYQITSDGNLCRDKTASCSEDNKIIIDTNGKKPSSGTVIIKGAEVQPGTILVMDDYTVGCEGYKCTATKIETYKITYKLTNVSGNNVTSITTKDVKTLKFTANSGYQLPASVTVSGATSVWDKETGTLILSKIIGNVTVTIVGEEIKLKTYTNGDVVYFNVDTGEKCSLSDYTETQSNTGVKEGCMKFYAFNDDGGDTVNLILDHNTTAKVVWISKEDWQKAGGTESDYGTYGKKDKGPLTLLAQLKEDTSSWQGTITPSNYTMDQTVSFGSSAKYTIDYSNHKARLITAQEITTITGNTSWDEKTASSFYYFDSKTTSASTTCKEGNTTGCQYGWLYDKTSKSCTTYGCLNNSDKETYGYWTASSLAVSFSDAWNVCYRGYVGHAGVNNGNASGVRPVIEVSKSKLS